MPWRDWQFWCVTVVAVLGVWAVLRQFLPKKGGGELPCSTCSAGLASREQLKGWTPQGDRSSR